MSQVKSLTINVGRKYSANYCTCDVALTAVIDLAEGDDPAKELRRHTRGLQRLCDEAIGDTESPTAFARRVPQTS